MKPKLIIGAGLGTLAVAAVLALSFGRTGGDEAEPVRPPAPRNPTATKRVADEDGEVRAAVLDATRVDGRLGVTRESARMLADEVDGLLAAYIADSPEAYERVLAGQGLAGSVNWGDGTPATNWHVVTHSMRGATIDPAAVDVTVESRDPDLEMQKLFGGTASMSIPNVPRGEDDPAFGEGGLLAKVTLPGNYPGLASDGPVAAKMTLVFVTRPGDGRWVLLTTGIAGADSRDFVTPPPAR